MSQPTVNAIALTNCDRQIFIAADELTEGDLIRHLDSNWQVLTKPQYTNRGISFEVLWLDFEQDNIQEVVFDAQRKFELLD